MENRKRELPEAVGRVRAEIETWRKVREKRSPMPARLWELAAELAAVHGVHRISKALRLSYESLRNRVQGRPGSAVAGVHESSGFVELNGVGLISSTSSSSVEVEMVKPDGARMAIRISGGSGGDMTSMIEDFWGRSR